MAKLAREEIQTSLRDVNGWKVSRGKFIVKRFRFRNFKQAMRFVNRLASLANKIGHYPGISIQKYSDVVVSLTTYEEQGITEHDFKFAKAIDRVRK
jgi:4a-hydroxytetrahydrobiopterin dehydratase